MAYKGNHGDKPARPFCHKQINGNCMNYAMEQLVSYTLHARLTFSAIDSIALKDEISAEMSAEHFFKNYERFHVVNYILTLGF